VIKRVIGKQIKRAFYTTRVHALLKRLHKSQYPLIIRYHSIGRENPLICESITVSLQEFEEQVRYFSKHFLTVSMTTLIDCLRHGHPFPPNALVLTFDDGYTDNYDAARVLQKYGLTGLFYITAGCIESEEKFWIAEVRHLLGHTQHPQVCVAFPQETFTATLQTCADQVAAMDRLTYLLKSVDVSRREDIRAQLRVQLDDVAPFPDDLMLTWGHLKDMVAMGMEIGAHTMTHANLKSATTYEAWF
jgi:peptidoglycan/xylan/chitin deacetylase (PgdA/CDA1 family)